MNKQKEQLLKRVVEMRALRLGVSEEEILARANETAARYESPCAEDVSDSDLKALLNSKYPTPQCIMPYEIEEYQELARLPEERQQHARDCAFCSALIEMATPAPERLREFLEIVRRLRSMRTHTDDETAAKTRIA